MAVSRMIGTRSNKMDSKGRVAVPAKWRDQLGEDIVLTPGSENCIYVYSTESFDAMCAAIENAPAMSNPEVRQTMRKLLGESDEMTLDKQGRILINTDLRKYADLKDDDDILFKGVGDHLEIWDRETWEKYDAGFSIAEGSKSFASLGL
ncbi:MAG: division/cell wall cluster transcriptional repressor MraZ [Lachnospiraceae bacterium]|nr:division/cell wall cluster transcriptional repressor MraZ [Lachnospiraceae bacterium]